MNDNKYDWIIVGGGIAGLSVAEILCREGKSVLILEKNDQIASETSKVFHEWLHSGALYSLVPDNLFTMRYLLGAMDDLLEFYSSFPRMNLRPTESGISILGDDGWFNNDYIEYRYKLRKLNPVWMSLVSRSLNVMDMVNKHDWLRRRAGSEYDSSKVELKHSFTSIHKQLLSNGEFYSKMSPDFTMNSRDLVADLLSSSMSNGLELITSAEVESINESESFVDVETTAGIYRGDNLAICSPDVISKKFDIPIKTGFAPMAVVENVPDSETSFVELDYYIKSCINLLKKPNGVGQAGGITLDTEEKIKPYLEYIIKQHKKRNPEIHILDDYVGLKRELVQGKEERNYLYHINQHHSKIWSVVLGKFTLAFSMAPEFFRRVYHRNPTKISGKSDFPGLESKLISKTSWQEIVNNKRT
jgi:hypothetical protein